MIGASVTEIIGVESRARASQLMGGGFKGMAGCLFTNWFDRWSCQLGSAVFYFFKSVPWGTLLPPVLSIQVCCGMRFEGVKSHVIC